MKPNCFRVIFVAREEVEFRLLCLLTTVTSSQSRTATLGKSLPVTARGTCPKKIHCLKGHFKKFNNVSYVTLRCTFKHMINCPMLCYETFSLSQPGTHWECTLPPRHWVCLRLLPAPAVAAALAAGRRRPPCTCPSSPASRTAAPPSRPGGGKKQEEINLAVTTAKQESQGDVPASSSVCDSKCPHLLWA